MSDVLIEIKRSPGQPIGLRFKKAAKPPYCEVKEVVEGGAAIQSGKIHVGDLLLGINGKNLQHVEPEQLLETMQQYRNQTSLIFEMRRMTFLKPTMNGDTPEINVRTPSPDVVDDSPLSSSNASPNRSPSASRRIRRSGTALPDIQEGRLAEDGTLLGLGLGLGLQDQKRLSLTPESSRKSPEIEKLKISKSTSLDLANLPQWRKSGSHSISLQYLIDGSETVDRLHNHVSEVKYKETGCTPHHCVGAHMNPKDSQWKRPYSHPRTREEIIPQAEDFIKQYYDSKKHALGTSYDQKYQARLREVRSEIDKTGFWDLTYEELTFGARTAWRNAPRCVNRIVWRQLEVLDARNVHTPKEMFDAICHHIKYANNGGNLRSTITVFAPRKKKNSDFRVWNIQLVRYCGYKNEDGTILGDPANVEFTEVCVRLGWEPPKSKTAFDVLPLVLQAHGGDPEVFEIPSEIVLETIISHPEFV